MHELFTDKKMWMSFATMQIMTQIGHLCFLDPGHGHDSIGI